MGLKAIITKNTFQNITTFSYWFILNDMTTKKKNEKNYRVIHVAVIRSLILTLKHNVHTHIVCMYIIWSLKKCLKYISAAACWRHKQILYVHRKANT